MQTEVLGVTNSTRAIRIKHSLTTLVDVSDIFYFFLLGGGGGRRPDNREGAGRFLN